MRVFVVDAFTDRAFSGNPAGVVLLDSDADAPWMQSVAAELRHSETAFVRRLPDGSYDLRWFTPTVEVDLCGHATLASAHVLASCGAPGPFSFHTRSGLLTASVVDSAIQLDFPAMPVTALAAPPGLVDAIGTPVSGVYGNDVDVLVEVANDRDVSCVEPNLSVLATVPCRAVIVTAAAAAGADHDFVSRVFAPRVGIDEDPVTGSAHCALGPFWAHRVGRSALTGVQVSGRGGRVGVEVLGERVLLTGTAVSVLDGELRA